MRDANGKFITTETACFECWKEHFTLLFQPLSADPCLTTAADIASINETCRLDPVSSQEIRSAMKKLNNCKSPGIYSTERCWKWVEKSWFSGSPMSTIMCLRTGPNDCIQGIILPFWKRKTTSSSVVTILHTTILHSCVLPAIRKNRRPQQAGFMLNCSIANHISALHLAIEKSCEFKSDRHIYIAFIDLKAAFNTVDHASFREDPPTPWCDSQDHHPVL